jgi:hypothetical protein
MDGGEEVDGFVNVSSPHSSTSSPGSLDSLSIEHGGRPPNLPPKTSDEWKRHRREIAKIEKEAVKRQEERKRRAAEREAHVSKATHKWADEFLPNWSEMIEKRRGIIRKWCKLGVPPRCRTDAWRIMILGPDRAAGARELYQIMAEKGMSLKDSDALTPIRYDLERTFPQLKFFQSGEPMHMALWRVLAAFGVHQPHLGYVQGMSFLAATLLLYLEEHDAFACLTQLISSSRYHLHAMFSMQMDRIGVRMKAFDMQLEQHLKLVYVRLKSFDILTEVFMMEWLLTVFTKALPLDIACRIWDLWLVDGEVWLVRVAIALLKLQSSWIVDADFDACMHCLTHMGEYLHDVETLLQAVHTVKIDAKEWNESLRLATLQQRP